jgi:hypothetical protein
MPQENAIEPISEEHAAAANEAVERRLSSSNKLDALIGGALEDAEKPDEFEDFVASRPHRQELKERHGADAAGVIKAFDAYGKELQANPAFGADLLRGDYLASSNISTMRHVERSATAAPANVKAEARADEHPWRKLDRLIEASLDEHLTGKRDADRAEMEAARPLFEQQKKANPSLTWTEFFANTVEADRQLFRDPDGYSRRLAAASGLPMTEIQQHAVHHSRQVDGLANEIEQMQQVGLLPNINGLIGEMTEIAAHPDFAKHRTGDLRHDAVKLHGFAERLQAQRQAEKNAAAATARAEKDRRTSHSSAAVLTSTINAALRNYPTDDE